jgi:septal ring factor EnvC (AmiA/AmiB activator)
MTSKSKKEQLENLNKKINKSKENTKKLMIERNRIEKNVKSNSNSNNDKSTEIIGTARANSQWNKLVKYLANAKISSPNNRSLKNMSLNKSFASPNRISVNSSSTPPNSREKKMQQNVKNVIKQLKEGSPRLKKQLENAEAELYKMERFKKTFTNKERQDKRELINKITEEMESRNRHTMKGAGRRYMKTEFNLGTSKKKLTYKDKSNSENNKNKGSVTRKTKFL